MKFSILVPNQVPGKSPYTPLTLPPIGATSVATSLDKRGYEAVVLDEAILGQLKPESIQTDVLGISAMTANVMRGYEFARRVKKEYPETVVVAGGPHVTFLPDEALGNGADIVVRGEGEEIMVDVADALSGKKRLSDILGISFKDKSGEIIHNPYRELVQDLDSLPSPDYSLVKGLPKNYIYPISRLRGCPYPCTFCAVTKMHGKHFRFRSPENIMKQLEYALPKRNIFFTDDNFFADPEVGKTTLRMMKERELLPDESWTTQMRVGVAKDPEISKLLQDTKCTFVFTGVESVNPKTLKEYHKGQTVQDTELFVRTMDDINIGIFAMYVLGGDNDTVETVEATADFHCERGIAQGQLTSLTPLPGTDLRKAWEKQKIRGKPRIITSDWNKYDLEHVVHTPMNMAAEELQRALNEARRQIYSSKKVWHDFRDYGLYRAACTLYIGHMVRARQRRQGFL